MILNSIPLCSYWQKDKLIQRYNEIGSRAFDRGFRQKSISDNELLFRNFEKCIDYENKMPNYTQCYSGVDLSCEKRKGNVICTVGTDGIKKWVVDIRYGNWSSPEMAEQIQDVNRTFKPMLINVENNAYQQSILDWMNTKKFSDIPISAYTTGKQKSDIDIGLPALDVQFERKQWIFYLPSHEVGCACSWCQFSREMKGYPFYSTSDFVMAFWFAERALAKGNIHFDFDYKSDQTLTSGLRKKIF